MAAWNLRCKFSRVGLRIVPVPPYAILDPSCRLSWFVNMLGYNIFRFFESLPGSMAINILGRDPASQIRQDWQICCRHPPTVSTKLRKVMPWGRWQAGSSKYDKRCLEKMVYLDRQTCAIAKFLQYTDKISLWQICRGAKWWQCVCPLLQPVISY